MSKAFSTLNGLKRAAKSLCREEGILHTVALERLSREAGFQNFVHASRILNTDVIPSAFPIQILVRWRNRDEKSRGSERLHFELPKPLSDFLKPQHLNGHYLGGYSLDGTEGLVGNTNGYGIFESQSLARREACRAARALQFILATGLQPSDGDRCYPKNRWHNRPPGANHDRKWYHPETKSYLLTIETYQDLSHSLQTECDDWSDKFGYDIVPSQRMSMHGLGTKLYFIAKRDSKLALTSVVDRFDRIRRTIDENDPSLRWEN